MPILHGQPRVFSITSFSVAAPIISISSEVITSTMGDLLHVVTDAVIDFAETGFNQKREGGVFVHLNQLGPQSTAAKWPGTRLHSNQRRKVDCKWPDS